MHNFRRSIVLNRSRLQEWFMSLSPSCSAGESAKGPCSPVSFPDPIPRLSLHLYIETGNWTACSRDVATQISMLSHSQTNSNFGHETNTHIVVEMGLSSLHQCVACQGLASLPGLCHVPPVFDCLWYAMWRGMCCQIDTQWAVSNCNSHVMLWPPVLGQTLLCKPLPSVYTGWDNFSTQSVRYSNNSIKVIDLMLVQC